MAESVVLTLQPHKPKQHHAKVSRSLLLTSHIFADRSTLSGAVDWKGMFSIRKVHLVLQAEDLDQRAKRKAVVAGNGIAGRTMRTTQESQGFSMKRAKVRLDRQAEWKSRDQSKMGAQK